MSETVKMTFGCLNLLKVGLIPTFHCSGFRNGSEVNFSHLFYISHGKSEEKNYPEVGKWFFLRIQKWAQRLQGKKKNT